MKDLSQYEPTTGDFETTTEFLLSSLAISMKRIANALQQPRQTTHYHIPADTVFRKVGDLVVCEPAVTVTGVGVGSGGPDVEFGHDFHGITASEKR